MNNSSNRAEERRANSQFFRHPWGWEWVVQDDEYSTVRVTQLKDGKRLLRCADDPIGHEIWVRKGMLRIHVDGDNGGIDSVIMPGASIDIFGVGPIHLIAVGNVEWVETTGWVDSSFCAWDIAVPLPVPSP